jgi:hypothetical protein
MELQLQSKERDEDLLGQSISLSEYEMNVLNSTNQDTQFRNKEKEKETSYQIRG